MKLIAQVAFSWAHRHVDIVAYEEGAVIETEDADLIRVSIEEGWASDSDAAAEPKKRGKKSSADQGAEEPALDQQ